MNSVIYHLTRKEASFCSLFYDGTELDIQFKNLLNDYYSRNISEKMTTALYTARK